MTRPDEQSRPKPSLAGDEASKDTWATGDTYEPYMGRWSRLVAREFLAWLAVPHDRTWLDVGCGTGALSHVILRTARTRSIVEVDPSEGYIAYARLQASDERLQFQGTMHMPVAHRLQRQPSRVWRLRLIAGSVTAGETDTR
jgi:SAM-dependent methyltransferase